MLYITNFIIVGNSSYKKTFKNSLWKCTAEQSEACVMLYSTMKKCNYNVIVARNNNLLMKLPFKACELFGAYPGNNGVLMLDFFVSKP